MSTNETTDTKVHWWPEQAWARTFLLTAAAGLLAGAVWGGVRGTSYPPTLPFAVVEGAVLVGVPALLVATLLAVVVAVVTRGVRR